MRATGTLISPPRVPPKRLEKIPNPKSQSTNPNNSAGTRLPQLHRMPRGDLRAAAPASQGLEPARQRKLGLRGIPPARELCRHRAAPVHLHPEAIEAERPRPIDV